MNRKSFGFLFLMILLCAQSISAATVNGNAFKDDQTDHSGITIQLETLPGVPATGFVGAGLLLGGLSLFLLRKRNRTAGAFGIVAVVSGLSCIGYAFATYTAVTNTDGSYSMTAVDPGDYRLDASAPGYFPEQLVPITIVDGPNALPTITLYPMGTPTSAPTQTPTDTPTQTPTSTPTNTPVFVSVGNMISISAGTFTQGSPLTEPCRGTNEAQFTHNLTRDLAVMETEITRQMWADLRAVQPSLPVDPSLDLSSPYMNQPVQANSWYEAVLFANLLSIQNGYAPCYYRDALFTNVVDATDYINNDHHCDFDADGYRLPTEGEWEYFCRAGTTSPFSCIESNFTQSNCLDCVAGTHPTLEQYCWYCGNSGSIFTKAAGTLLANPWNLKDVHGNVFEMCWDWYGSYPTGSVTDYTGLTTGSSRVYRGGTHILSADSCRSAERGMSNPGVGSFAVGFRLVRTCPYATPTPVPTNTPVPTDTPTMTPTESPTTPTETPIPAGYLISTDDIVGNMRYVPGGTFTQGSPGTEPCRWSNETQFTHTLTRNLSVMETEVTRQMWVDLLAVQPSLPGDPSYVPTSPSLSHPVQLISWYEAVLFANLLSVQNGYTPCYYRDSGFTDVVDSGDYINDDHYCDFDADGYRLATEGEWEYFCRAGTTTAFSCNETNYNGSNCYSCSSGAHPTLEQYCVYCVNFGTTGVAGSKLANPWNLNDVHGNVWEWCWDRAGTYPAGPETDYEGAGSGSYRVYRGGSYGADARNCRSAKRFIDGAPYSLIDYLGFRLVRTTD